MEFIKRCWAEISLKNLLSNLNKIKSLTNTNVICVVKANAYSHGDIQTMNILQQNGVSDFAVASVYEGIHLRNGGCNGNILVLGGCLVDHIPYAVKHNITLTVLDVDFAKQLSDYATSNNCSINVHLKLNTGMNRIGFNCTNDGAIADTVQKIEYICALKGVNIVGAFTHFAVSDEQNGADFTNSQINRLETVKNSLSQKGIKIDCWHAANSGAILNYKNAHLDAVRAGILLYGCYDSFGADSGFKPVLSLKSTITYINTLSNGDSVSYGCTYTAQKSTKAATVSIGYGDGLPRSLSNKGSILVNGKFAKIIGRVCMDQIIVDVTDIDCKVGDTVTIIGSDGENEITATDIAKLDDTISYEILCRISPRVTRVYK